MSWINQIEYLLILKYRCIDRMQHLPDELLQTIAEFLPHRDQCRLKKLCRAFYWAIHPLETWIEYKCYTRDDDLSLFINAWRQLIHYTNGINLVIAENVIDYVRDANFLYILIPRVLIVYNMDNHEETMFAIPLSRALGRLSFNHFRLLLSGGYSIQEFYYWDKTIKFHEPEDLNEEMIKLSGRMLVRRSDYSPTLNLPVRMSLGMGEAIEYDDRIQRYIYKSGTPSIPEKVYPPDVKYVASSLAITGDGKFWSPVYIYNDDECDENYDEIVDIEMQEYVGVNYYTKL